MVKKTLFLIILFYFLALFQTSFLIHFPVLGIVPNLVLITIILINLFTSSDQWFGVAAALIGGICLDIFSAGIIAFFGFYTLISLIISFFIKFIVRKYVQIPEFKKGR